MNNKLKRRIRAIFAAGAVSATTLLSASCIQIEEPDSTWTYDRGVLTLSGDWSKDDWMISLEIPWQLHIEDIEMVIFEEGTSHIGDGAFMACPKLSEVTIPDTVTGIGATAFYQCAQLSSIKIPESVTEIGVNAFTGCDGIVIKCVKGSYAEQYALENTLDIEYIPGATAEEAPAEEAPAE